MKITTSQITGLGKGIPDTLARLLSVPHFGVIRGKEPIRIFESLN